MTMFMAANNGTAVSKTNIHSFNAGAPPALVRTEINNNAPVTSAMMTQYLSLSVCRKPVLPVAVMIYCLFRRGYG